MALLGKEKQPLPIVLIFFFSLSCRKQPPPCTFFLAHSRPIKFENTAFSHLFVFTSFVSCATTSADRTAMLFQIVFIQTTADAAAAERRKGVYSVFDVLLFSLLDDDENQNSLLMDYSSQPDWSSRWNSREMKTPRKMPVLDQSGTHRRSASVNTNLEQQTDGDVAHREAVHTASFQLESDFEMYEAVHCNASEMIDKYQPVAFLRHSTDIVALDSNLSFTCSPALFSPTQVIVLFLGRAVVRWSEWLT